MPITIEKIPDAPIIVVHAHPATGDIRQEAIEAIAQIIQALDEQTENVYMITDMREIKLDLDDIIMSSSLGARGQNNLMHHPKLRGVIYVLGDGMMKMAIRGLNSATFGQVKALAFDTVEDAIAHCREKIGQLDL